jgi:hypothetical protein
LKGKYAKWLSLVLTAVVASSIVYIASAPVTLPLVSVDPEENVANPCESFTVNITVQDVVDLYSYGLKMGFNRYVLEVTSVTEGPFLKQGGSTFFIKKIYADYIDVGCVLLGAVPGVSGSGTLLSVAFHVKDAGKSGLDINDDNLLDSTLAVIPHDTADGYFYTTAEANLVRKSAWPEHHHFDVSKDEDFNATGKETANQTLFGKVRNLGPIDLYVYVSFDLVRDDGFVATVTSAVAVVTPDTIVDLSADFEVNSTDAGKYAVTAKAYYSYSGSYYAEGAKVKTFSFAVVP